MTAFEFATATRVVFGAGKAATLPDWVQERGAERVLLVSGRDGSRAAAVSDALAQHGVQLTRFAVAGEPTVAMVREGTAVCKGARAQAVIALGGGSAIDAGKAIAALAENEGDPLDYLEVVGRGQALRRASLPFAALPTTAGTGAEVTRNAVLGAPEHGVKASLRSPLMLPQLALVDPDLLQGAPAEVLRASGLDALSQLIEPYVSVRAQPMSDALAREGLLRSRRSLERAVLDGAGPQEREDLALASLFGGLCLANAGLGAVHGFAAPAGGMYQAPHGAVCAALLPHVMAINLRAIDAREPALRSRYNDIARILTGHASARAEDGVQWVETLCRALAVPGLSAYGMTRADLTTLVDKAERASSMRGNSLVLTRTELAEIAERALSAS
jgi:alcohol dehydrogenase class IV